MKENAGTLGRLPRLRDRSADLGRLGEIRGDRGTFGYCSGSLRNDVSAGLVREVWQEPVRRCSHVVVVLGKPADLGEAQVVLGVRREPAGGEDGELAGVISEASRCVADGKRLAVGRHPQQGDGGALRRGSRLGHRTGDGCQGREVGRDLVAEVDDVRRFSAVLVVEEFGTAAVGGEAQDEVAGRVGGRGGLHRETPGARARPCAHDHGRYPLAVGVSLEEGDPASLDRGARECEQSRDLPFSGTCRRSQAYHPRHQGERQHRHPNPEHRHTPTRHLDPSRQSYDPRNLRQHRKTGQANKGFFRDST